MKKASAFVLDVPNIFLNQINLEKLTALTEPLLKFFPFCRCRCLHLIHDTTRKEQWQLKYDSTMHSPAHSLMRTLFL